MERSSPSLLAMDEPVVVLTHARSGSTLLRMILDAHPELACPAETNIVKICGHLAQAWQAMAPPRPSDDPLPRAAAITIKTMVNSTLADHLLRTGKRRWCDKSLGTVRALHPFAGLYPKTQYVCLYRHCMDVIDSALEASPFGLLGYGYENFIARFDGNSVAAIAAAWCEDTTMALDFEEANPEHCHRVYYENLVESPESVAAGLLSFLGVEPAPGITDACFAVQGDITGPGDHKVTVTNRVVADSVGRGVRVPADLLPRGLLHLMNGLLDRLGYAVVDDDWRQSVPPPTLFPGRAPAARSLSPAPSADLVEQVAERISEQVGRRLTVPLPAAARGAVGPTRRIGLAVYGPGPHPVTRYWRLDLDRGQSAAEAFVPVTTSPRVDWLVTGEARSWLSVLSGEKNVASSLRDRNLRCVDFGRADPAGVAASNRRSRSYPAIINHLLDLDESRAARAIGR
jgi:hypothetical protein